MDIANKIRYEEMDSAFNESIDVLKKAISDIESDESEKEETSRHRRGKSCYGLSEERELNERAVRLAKNQRGEFIQRDKEMKKSLLLQKAKEGRKENAVIIGTIEHRINHFKPLTDEQWKFLGVKNPTKFQNTLMKSITGEVGVSSYNVRNLFAGELLSDNPGNYTSMEKVPEGNIQIATLSDANMEKIYGQFRPEQKPIIGKVTDLLVKQGRNNYQYTPIGSSTPVTVSAREILERVILLTKLKKNPLNAEQVTTLESLINQGKSLNEQMLRKLFSSDTLL